MRRSLGCVLVATGMLAGCGDDGGAASGDAGADAGPDGPPNTAALVWFADWRTGTGTSQAALSDGGKFNDQLCNADVLSVVPSTGLAFPTPHVLRTEYAQPSLCRMMRAHELWRAAEVGEYLFVRLYYRNAMPDGAQVGFPHPLHIGEGSPYAMWVNFFGPPGGRSSMTLQLDGTHVYPDTGWSYRFATNETYRIELRLNRTTATTGKAAVRVFDHTG